MDVIRQGDSRWAALTPLLSALRSGQQLSQRNRTALAALVSPASQFVEPYRTGYEYPNNAVGPTPEVIRRLDPGYFIPEPEIPGWERYDSTPAGNPGLRTLVASWRRKQNQAYTQPLFDQLTRERAAMGAPHGEFISAQPRTQDSPEFIEALLRYKYLWE